MEAKLRSILRRIHSPLALKAAIFGAAWFFLPLWVFVVVALYLYIVPRFRAVAFGFPFLVLMFFMVSETPTTLGALAFSILFYLLLGIKEMRFIEKRTPYEVFILLLMFFAYTRFFSRFVAWDSVGVFLYAFAMGFVLFLLCRGFLGYAVPRKEDESTHRGLIGIGVVAFLVWELLLTVVFLPVNFLYQSALLFIVTAVLFGVALDHAQHKFVPMKTLMSFSVFFVFLVIILGSAKWAL